MKTKGCRATLPIYARILTLGQTGHWYFKSTWLYKIVAWILTMLFVGLLWIPFRATDFFTFQMVFSRMFYLSDGILWQHPTVWGVLSVVVIWHISHKINSKLLFRFPSLQPLETKSAFLLGFFILLIVLIGAINTSPFIYFQF